MARLPYPIYGLENLYLFRRYQTCADYQKATGQEPPPFTPNQRPKYWFDPTAKDGSRRNVVYDNTLVVSEFGKPIPGPDGKPMLDLLTLPKLEAATVNIPPEGTNIEGTDAWLPRSHQSGLRGIGAIPLLWRIQPVPTAPDWERCVLGPGSSGPATASAAPSFAPV